MPYELIAKAGLSTGILLILAFIIWELIKYFKQIVEDNKNFVSSVIEKSEQREHKLLEHIEKQDSNMERITSTLDKMDYRLQNIERKIEQ